jgi:hypothetical protein
MKIDDFLKCEHNIDINTSMTRLYCVKCGQDANVISYVKELRILLKKCLNLVEMCNEGDFYDEIKKTVGDL